MDYADAQITGVSFRLFTEPEAKKLSVIHVKRPESLDPLGHPYENGLQDTSFGPLKRDDFCKTCGLTDITCLGHYGTVELPLPVFNPFLMKHLSQVLKMCCFNCHHLLYSASELELYIAQLRALHFGLDFILPDLIEYANEIRNGNAGFDWRSVDGQNYMRGRLNDKINGELFKLKNNNVKAETHELLDEFVANIEDIEIVNSKYVVEKKQQLFKDFFAGKVLKPARQCHACQAHKAGMNVINRSVIVLSLSKAAKSMKKFDETDLNISIEVKGKTYLTPSDARQHLRLLWGNEESTLKRIFPFINFDLEELTGQLPEELTPEEGLPSKYCPLDVFFWETLIIAPNRFRPLRVLRGRSFEHYKTSMLAEIMIVAQGMDYWLKSAKDKASSDSIQKFHHQWQRLQTLCNRLYDSEMDKLPDNKAIGVKQILEKKEGLLRKNMMGKRVNFAARSVISPDPYIAADEIGIPVIFATRLYYPQPVAPWNMNQLEQAIINGPLVWPGAMSVKFPDGNVVRLSATKEDQRKKIAAMIRMPKENLDQFGGYIVNRHLISGDTLLLNRQPTLHKPSIMAHKARVLPKEKTLRLHYANCKSYNADFDGDEMNAHFPQSELARAEAYEIASVNYQFLVPKDGSPLSGLIQDHIIAGFFLSVRGSYFNKGDYQNLVFGALSFLNKPIKLLPPAIMKPSELWTGKQIISTLVINIVPDGKQLPSFDIDSKIKPKMFVNDTPEEEPFNGGLPMKDSDMCESQVIFRQGELLCGVMDKVNFGANKNGLIHVCYELYGQDIHTKLLTAVARLSTNYVQCVSGFTLGIHDILVRSKPNKQRKKLMKVSTTVGPQAFADAFNLKETFEENQITEELIHEKMSMAQTSRDDFYLKQLDAAYKQQTDKLSNEISSACMPKGLVKQFPSNNLQMMIQTGAKGGAVNAIQISCLLGQIELEGRRIPLMMSGRTLPSFKKYDITPRAGGFIAGRFLTGIRPQEFFFHCMAGREGLIDTAVKTSRSGYLQRCLIKHLEGLVVNYDMTVRDSEGSVIQWMYGEDGCDIIKCQSLHKSFLPIIMKNQEVFKPSKEDIKRLKKARQADVSKLMKEVRESVKAHENVRYRSSSGLSKFSEKYLESFSNATQAEIQDQWLRLTNEERISYDTPRTKDPVISTYTPNVNFGAISESLDSIIENYINSDLAQSDKKLVKSFKQSMNNCYMRSLAAPGEAVGLLAAQSIGEPSTQMTLNTFHFAGRGEMNVTLGVPRLRELLMTASPNISNPSMEIPIRTDLPIDMDIAAEAEKVRIQINAVRLKDVLEYVDVEEKIVIVPKQLHQRFRSYKVRFNFLPSPLYKTRCFTKPAKIIHFMESSFIKQFIEALSKKFRILQSRSGLFDTRTIINRTSKKTVNADEEEIVMSTVQNEYEEQDNKRFQMEEDEEEAEDAEFCDVDAGEGDTTAMRHKSRFNQDQEYEEKDEEENEKNDDDSDEESDDVKKPKSASKVKEEVEDMEEEMAKMFGTSAVKITTAKKTTKKVTIDQQEQVKAYMNERKQRVLNIGRGTVIDYDYDIENELWCEVTMQFELYSTKLDLRSVIYEEASKAFIHRLGRVDRAFLVKDNDAAKKGARYDQLVKTEGVSMAQVVHFDSILDIKRIYTNDMHAIANTFGIEAARNALIREISSVFAVYGISVDGRHLTLIADHMTFSGKIKGMNRASMDGISPLQAMTFETTTAFMKNSLLMNLSDDLKSPSSRLVIGRPTMVGSGLFETRVNPKLMEEFLGKKTALPTTATAEPCPETGVQIPIPHSLSSKNRFSLSAFKRKRPLTPVDEDGGDQPEPISEDAQSEQVNLKNVKLELFDETIEEPVATKRVKTEYISDAE